MTGWTRTSDVQIKIETKKVAGETLFLYRMSADYVDGSGRTGDTMTRRITAYSTDEVRAILITF